MVKNIREKEVVVTWLHDTLVVIVLYNVEVKRSITFQALKKAVSEISLDGRINLLLCDNSKNAQENLNKINDEGFFNLFYLHDPTNPGVSKSYNRAADLAMVKDMKYLLVLDQDTELPKTFPIKFQQSIEKFPIYPLYAPKIYSGSLLFSPCRYLFHKGSNLNEIKTGVNKMKFHNVLNSGLLISLEAFREAEGYNEVVQLYFSDFVFFDRLKKRYKDFVVVDCRLEHELSSVDYSNISFALKRFSYYCLGARQASSVNTLAYFDNMVNVGLRSLFMSYRFKSLEFVKVYKKYFFKKNAQIDEN